MAIYKRGGVYWYSFQFQGRRIQESSGFANRTAALRAEAKRRSELLDRRAGFSRTKLAPKFEEYVPNFLAWSSEQHRHKTRVLHGLNCDTLLRFFHGYWLDEITPGMIEEFKVARAREASKTGKKGKTVSPASVNRALTTLKLLFHQAEKSGYALAKPMQGVAFYSEGPGRLRVVSFEEEFAYLNQAHQPLSDIAQIILDTGMRPEEVFRVRTENLDFSEKTIFNPFGKTKAARRKLTMTANVFDLLVRRAKETRGPFVFPSPHDPNRHIGSVKTAHGRAMARAGVKDAFRLYDLRHTFATRAVAAGVDLPTLSAILGHANIQMTMRYVHPAEEQKRIASAKLEAFRVAGMVQVVENRQAPSTISTTVN
jgi:integrase